MTCRETFLNCPISSSRSNWPRHSSPTYGRPSGRDFPLELRRTDDGRVLRIEATDTRGDRVPGLSPQLPPPDAESGRGLLLVEVLADRWGVASGPVPRTTVWAELDLARSTSPLRVNMPN
ncbi:ATP-binding protein [Streptomyces sp. NBC_00838]|uniref:ATP-binding protein n=1 Tax=Streptomyces sp. NBC_00838 TaxID=2903680 RepID=UPI00387024C7|nr:ATP-binding protein [Streptomyces sp. NBC_00838]